MLVQQQIEYDAHGLNCIGELVYEESIEGKRPAVLVCHDWSGRNTFAQEKAAQLAKMGYVGFAIDMYGHGKLGQTKEEKMALMNPLIEDRALLVQRISSALNVLKQCEVVESRHIAAIGFCFGGLCVLDLARSGAHLAGVVSFHGLLGSAPGIAAKSVSAAVLALHGYDDPMVTPDQVKNFADEMTHLKADWRLVMYGQTMHAFMNKEANDPGFGTVYQPRTEKRAWQAMELFLKEIFSK